MHRIALFTLSSLSILGCSDPTLEEACADYCTTVEAAGCDRPTSEECSGQCDGVREQLKGQCIEEYTDAFECTADLEYECQEGTAQPAEVACIDEAFALLDCMGFGEEDSSSSSP